MTDLDGKHFCKQNVNLKYIYLMENILHNKQMHKIIQHISHLKLHKI